MLSYFLSLSISDTKRGQEIKNEYVDRWKSDTRNLEQNHVFQLWKDDALASIIFQGQLGALYSHNNCKKAIKRFMNASNRM